jgi:hypothetical protein
MRRKKEEGRAFRASELSGPVRAFRASGLLDTPGRSPPSESRGFTLRARLIVCLPTGVARQDQGESAERMGRKVEHCSF